MRVYSGPSHVRFVACLLSLLLLAVVTGCATSPPTRDRVSGNEAACLQQFADNDRLIDQANRRDPGISRIPGFPFLRANRFLASFRNELSTSAQLDQWTRHLAALDAETRRLELNNLPDAALRRQAQAQLGGLEQCRDRLRRVLLRDPESIRRLRAASEVPDDYVTGWRVLGLYPLTAPLVSLRIGRWHAGAMARFALPLDALPVSGSLRRWSTRRPGPVTGATPAWGHDALGIPRLDAETAKRLFDRHAPVWEVDVISDDDRVGTLAWRNGVGRDGFGVDTRSASEYRLISFTRFGNLVLPQLNYLVWFPSRPSRDIYGGRFDGLHWRVTLGPDGSPWLYDSIHHCGCYYMAFPTEHLQPRGERRAFTEPALMPQAAPPAPLVLRIAPVTHYIERLYQLDGNANALEMRPRPYDRLRSLATGSGWRSLFSDHGLVAGSERPERFILWPMGIRSPGAMRQVGRHAIAFVGRRHFDDPFLIPTLFEATGR